MEVDTIASRIIRGFTQEDRSSIADEKDFWMSPKFIYNYNYSDIEPLIRKGNKIGCDPFPEWAAIWTMEQYIFHKIQQTEKCLEPILKEYAEEACTFSSDKYVDGIYIPANIAECIQELDKEWDNDLKDEFKKDSLNGLMEDEIGRSIRNSWGLWSRSRLAKYFVDFGVTDNHHMSSIILNCYKRHLLNLPIEFEIETERSRKRLDTTRPPLLKDYPKEARNVMHMATRYLDEGALYFFAKSRDSKNYWVYHTSYGWMAISKEEYEEERANPEEWINKIYKK